jgi:glycosyltransferase involved in cell wall biosynthesis
MTEPNPGRRVLRPVVLLAYHYPPSREVGALRAIKVARALAAAQHPVTVVRAAGAEEEPPADEQGIQVVSMVPAASPRQWYARLRGAARGSAAGGADLASAPATAWVPPRRASALKRLVLSLFWLPDDKQGFIWRAAKAAAEAVRRSGPGAVLYSTSPPHSTHLAALLAQLWTRAPWIMELRDPWTDNPGKPWYRRSAFADAVERWLERRCLARARLVVGVSEGICDLVERKLTRKVSGRVLLIRNGIDEVFTPGLKESGEPMYILHVGTCYMGRDPRPFLQALASEVRSRGLGPSDVQVELVGRCEWFGGVSMREVVRELGLENLVRFIPWLPHAEARARLARADLLLLLAEGQPHQVPNKLYEYLGSRKRMLVFADPRGETARMVTAVGGHLLTRAADPNLGQVVGRALAEPAPAAVGDVGLLAEWGASRQLAKLVQAVQALEDIPSA